MGYTNNNVIDNEIGNLKSNNNNIDNESKKKKYEQSKRVDMIVDDLVSKFKKNGHSIEEKSKPFLYLSAWKLSEAKLWNNFEQAVKGSNPIGLFIYLCKRDGV